VSILEDAEALRSGDPQGLVDVYLRCGDQLRTTYGPAAEHPIDASGIRAVVFCGMGGSAAAADVAAAVSEADAPVGVSVRRGYRLPAWVGRDTLVVCVSYSGDTEEAVAAFDEAASRGARTVAISAGGALADRAGSASTPHLSLPGGIPQPRAALGAMTGAALGALVAAGVLEDAADDVEAAVSSLRSVALDLAHDAPAERNHAKRVAAAVADRVPVIWGSEGVSEAAAWRWKCAFNENAEIPAFASSLPELDHHEVVGWTKEDADRYTLVVLREPGEHGSVGPRLAATLEEISSPGRRTVEVQAEGGTTLAHALSLMVIGDVASAYHAIARGIDPGPIDALTRVKQRLSERP
jgi:glucose/mannose-6-phosphate isomerase